MYKLLVVDDENAARVAICNYFPWDELNFEVIFQCDDGLKALEYLRANEVDVVFCDIVMPRMSGVELIENLRKENIPVRVVFLSGQASFEYAKKALAFGAKDYIVKPAKYRELLEVFTRVREELDAENKIAGDEEQNDIQADHYEKIVQTVDKYIEENFKTATLESSAEAVFMNANYLSQFYKTHTGVNFSERLLQVRMRKATEFLDDIRYKIYDISEMVGYTNAKNFARAFKKFYGIKPREYRQKGGRHG